MRRHHALASAWLSLLLAGAGADPVIAERGTDQITVSQARALLAAADPDMRHQLSTSQAALKEFLRNILIQRAVLQQAQAEKWEARPEIAALLARTHDQVVVQSFLAANAAPPAAYPSDAELQAAYDQNKQKFLQPRSYHLTQLFVAKPAAGVADDGKRRLTVLRAQVERGRVNFADAAKHDAGIQYIDMGWVSDKQLLPAVKDAVAGLLEGGLTDTVCVDNGCHLIRLVATRPAGPAPLADIRDGLARALRQQKQAEGERAYASALLAKQPVAVDEIQLSRIAP